MSQQIQLRKFNDENEILATKCEDLVNKNKYLADQLNAQIFVYATQYKEKTEQALEREPGRRASSPALGIHERFNRL